MAVRADEAVLTDVILDAIKIVRKRSALDGNADSEQIECVLHLVQKG